MYHWIISFRIPRSQSRQIEMLCELIQIWTFSVEMILLQSLIRLGDVIFFLYEFQSCAWIKIFDLFVVPLYLQDALRRILIIFAKLNSGIRYVQGMNEVLAPLFYVFRTDPDSKNAVRNRTIPNIKLYFLSLIPSLVERYCFFNFFYFHSS